MHRVIPWDDVSLEDGTGIVHIAPGRHRGLRARTGTTSSPCSSHRRERAHDARVRRLHGPTTDEVADLIAGDLRERGLLEDEGRIVHRYPTAGAARRRFFRVVDDWFIAVDEIRQPMLDANATVEWTPSFYWKRMDDWLRNMDDWNISRKRYFGLPLPIYPCGCGHLT